MRVLEWIVGRVEGKAQAQEHVFGHSPRFEDLRWDGLSFSAEQFASVVHIDPQAWQAELVLHDELFGQLAHRLPAELPATKVRLAHRLMQAPT